MFLIIGMVSTAWHPEDAWEFTVTQGKSASLSVSFAQQNATIDAPLPVMIIEPLELIEESEIESEPVTEDAEDEPVQRTLELAASELDRSAVAVAPFPTTVILEREVSVPDLARKQAEAMPQIEVAPRVRVTRRELSRTPPEAMPAVSPSQQNEASNATVAEKESGAIFDEPPKKLPNNQAPEYPLDARLAGVEGRVLLLVKIDTTGKVSDAKIDQSSGHASLDKSALQTVRMWRFSPAKRTDAAVEAEVLVPVRFTLRGN